jgi:hypothetical protein
MKLRNYLTQRFIFGFIFTAVAMSTFIKYLDSKDPRLERARTVLTANADIEKQFGSILSADVTKRFYVEASAHQPPYNEFVFFVKGNKAKGLVTVRVKKNTDAEILPNYQISSIGTSE